MINNLILITILLLLLYLIRRNRTPSKFVLNARVDKPKPVRHILVKYISVFIAAGTLIFPMTANAQIAPNEQITYMDECAPQYLQTWDLPAAIKEKAPHYINGTTPIVITKHVNIPDNRNVYDAWIPTTSTGTMTLGYSSDLYATIYTNGSLLKLSVQDEPIGAAYGFDSFYYPGNIRPYVSPNPATFTSSTNTFRMMDMSQAKCWVTMMNVPMVGSWTSRYSAPPLRPTVHIRQRH